MLIAFFVFPYVYFMAVDFVLWLFVIIYIAATSCKLQSMVANYHPESLLRCLRGLRICKRCFRAIPWNVASFSDLRRSWKSVYATDASVNSNDSPILLEDLIMRPSESRVLAPTVCHVATQTEASLLLPSGKLDLIDDDNWNAYLRDNLPACPLFLPPSVPVFISLFDALQLGSDSSTHSVSSVAVDNEGLTEDREIIARGRSQTQPLSSTSSVDDNAGPHLETTQVQPFMEKLSNSLSRQMQEFSQSITDCAGKQIASIQEKYDSRLNRLQEELALLGSRQSSLMADRHDLCHRLIQFGEQVNSVKIASFQPLPMEDDAQDDIICKQQSTDNSFWENLVWTAPSSCKELCACATSSDADYSSKDYDPFNNNLAATINAASFPMSDKFVGRM